MELMPIRTMGKPPLKIRKAPVSRTKAREIALHLIFEMGFQQFEPENLEERLDENIMRSLKTDAE